MKLANETLKELDSKLSHHIAELNQAIFNHKQIKFKANEWEFDSTVIGHIETEKSYRNVELHRSLEGHESCVNVLVLLSDGNIVSGSYDSTVRIWDHETGELLKTLYGHTSYVLSLAVLQKEMVASGSIDGTIIVWDTVTGNLELQQTGRVE